jgi:antitoxin MazE
MRAGLESAKLPLYTHCIYVLAQEGSSMSTYVQRWGNSLALRIPKALALELGIGEGSAVALEVMDGTLIVRRVEEELSLESLLAGITDENRHSEIGTGTPRGAEAW